MFEVRIDFVACLEYSRYIIIGMCIASFVWTAVVYIDFCRKAVIWTLSTVAFAMIHFKGSR